VAEAYIGYPRLCIFNRLQRVGIGVDSGCRSVATDKSFQAENASFLTDFLAVWFFGVSAKG
jgi:hypothetical protein